MYYIAFMQLLLKHPKLQKLNQNCTPYLSIHLWSCVIILTVKEYVGFQSTKGIVAQTPLSLLISFVQTEQSDIPTPMWEHSLWSAAESDAYRYIKATRPPEEPYLCCQTEPLSEDVHWEAARMTWGTHHNKNTGKMRRMISNSCTKGHFFVIRDCLNGFWNGFSCED